ncbi:ADP-ribosyl-[dinitrogen reductase] hydrolase [Martelella mediterranea DSM 17316]|uniref:ADP-ribosyl-[dinitrogen reductase] hydrolase n=1 Tax=Martelella mediterranea DSM 17316 TaxID=1122214 RepID=A0A1U9Z3E0_9HYPH|nr:ADP-ribosyl-[dinitrogen reductase] hydrolase [Martelella mediterranea DSM 17316]
MSAACVADALGAATECMHPDEIVRVFGGPVTTFRTPPEKSPFARGLAPGRLTDDATQMLAMARRIIGLDRPPVSADAIAGFIDWSHDEEMFQRFAGPTTRIAVEAMRAGAPAEAVATPEVYSCMFGTSNGGAMRAPTAGCAAAGNLSEAVRLACLMSAPTHNTQIAYAGASAVAGAIAVGLSGDRSMTVSEAAIEGARQGEAEARRSGRIVGGAGVLRRIEIAFEVGLRYKADLEAARAELIEVIGNGVAMAEAVPHAFGLVVAADGDPWQAIVAAVNGGNDSDTIAMIAGSVAAAWNGAESIPAALIEEVSSVNGLDFARIAEGLAKFNAQVIAGEQV